MSEQIIRFVKKDLFPGQRYSVKPIAERTCDTCGRVALYNFGMYRLPETSVGWEGIHHLSGGRHYCIGCRPALRRVTNGC